MARPRRISHVIGIDDAPFERGHRGDVPIVGAVCTRARLDGVHLGRVRRDGANATRAVAAMVAGSRFRAHLQLILLQGIALAGFNVVDLAALHEESGLPVLAVARRRPDLDAMRRALLTRVPGGARKWRLIQAAGAMEPCAGIWIQRAGLAPAAAEAAVRDLAVYSQVPEPLRMAHIIAAGLAGAAATGRV